MRPRWIVLSLLACVIGAWWLWRVRQDASPPPASATEATAARDQPSPPVPATPSPAPAGQPAPTDPSTEPLATGTATPRQQSIYRFVLEDGACRLEAVEQATGDFRAPRSQAWQAGMLCCRVLDAQNVVLQQQTLPAPDYSCVVLDPNVLDESGRPLPTRFTAGGPVVFQTRFPALRNAATIKIYRLADGTRPAGNAEPAGTLLGSISLLQR